MLYAAIDDLQSFVERVFMAAAMDSDSARQIAEHLLFADIRGLTTDGVARVPDIVRQIQAGTFEPHPNLTIRTVSSTVATIDGGNGHGTLVGSAAMRKAVSLAAENGIGVVTVCRSNRCGASSFFAGQALERTFIGITVANRSTAESTGVAGILGGNPFAVAVPAGRYPPIIVDRSAPTQPMMSDDGEAMILPILIEVFAGVLSGAEIGRRVAQDLQDSVSGDGTGMFFMAVDPGIFMPVHSFLDRVDGLIDLIKMPAADAAHEPPQPPGHRLLQREKASRKSGVAIPENVMDSLAEVCREVGVSLPTLSRAPLHKGR